MSTVPLKDCQALKKAEYPQDGAQQYWVRYYDDRDGSDYWRIETKNLYPDNGFAIPTLQPLLDWFVKDFAERWAKKKKEPFGLPGCYKWLRAGCWEFHIIYSPYNKNWLAGIWDTHDRDSYWTEIFSSSPLTAVLELFMQMWKEMCDENSKRHS